MSSTTVVRGADCVLSNFYPWPCVYEDLQFRSTEHLYQYQKALHHDDTRTADQIMHAPTAARAKQLASHIVPTATWQNHRVIMMRKLLDHKFYHCLPFRHQLMTTVGYIDHPVPDAFWGSVARDHRQPQNTFGLLLAQLRNRHRRPSPHQTTVLVLGHSFIHHLARFVADPSNPLEFAVPDQRYGNVSVAFHGKSGATLDRLLAYVKNCQLLDHYQPSVILLQMGGNDLSMQSFQLSQFEVTIDAFTSYCQSVGCDVMLMGIWKRLRCRGTTVDEYNSRRGSVHSMLHFKHTVEQSLWFYPARNVSTKVSLLGKDGVHPSSDGYRCLGKVLSRAIGWYLWKTGC